MQTLTEAEREQRRKKVAEAIGLCVMSGLPEDKGFSCFLEKYISGECTMDEIKSIISAEAEQMRKEDKNNGTGE